MLLPLLPLLLFRESAAKEGGLEGALLQEPTALTSYLGRGAYTSPVERSTHVWESLYHTAQRYYCLPNYRYVYQS